MGDVRVVGRLRTNTLSSVFRNITRGENLLVFTEMTHLLYVILEKVYHWEDDLVHFKLIFKLY